MLKKFLKSSYFTKVSVAYMTQIVHKRFAKFTCLLLHRNLCKNAKKVQL